MNRSLYILLWLGLSIVHINHTQNQISNSIRPIAPNLAQTIATQHFQTSIAPLEINSNGTRMIDKEGDYYITKDISFHPVNNTTDDSVLHITVSNVSVNLNAKQISQASGNNTSLVRGIVIDPGLSNIVIYNGSIHDCSGAGIIIGENCKNIALSKVSVVNCGLTGIAIGYNPFDTGTYPSVFQAQETIRFVDPSTGPANSTEDIVLDNVYVACSSGYFNGTSTDYSHAIGIQLVDVKNFQMFNTISNSNQYAAPDGIKNSTTDPGGYYVATRTGYSGYGFHFVRCQNGYLNRCEASSNIGWSGYGYLFEQSQNMQIDSCFAHHNESDADPTLHTVAFDFLFHRDLGRAAGFMFHDSSSNTLTECESFYTKGVREAAGFWFRRYLTVSSDSQVLNSQLIDPTVVQPQIAVNNTIANVDIGNVLLIPEVPSSIPAVGTGYTVTTAPIYLVHAGSNCNICDNCHTNHTSSTYLGAHGILSQGNTNNAFSNIIAQNSVSGSGSEAYNTTSIYDFDTGVGVWGLTEYKQYRNPHTDSIIQYATGISLECTQLPLVVWDGSTMQLRDDGGDMVFFGTKIEEPDVYAIPCWSETCSSVCDGCLRENYGSCVGTGVGVLLNGTFNNIVKQSWLYCNHSCSLGSVSTLCADMPSGIGALGGYGLLDLATNSTTLALDNRAYANQIIQPIVITDCMGGISTTGTGPCIEGANYHVTYHDVNLSLPVKSASIADFSALTTLCPFSNIEWFYTGGITDFLGCSGLSIKTKPLVGTEPAVFTI